MRPEPNDRPRLGIVGGQACVLVPATHAAELALLLRWACDLRHRAGQLPLLAAVDLEQALRAAARCAEVLAAVPIAEQVHAPAGAAGEDLITTRAAARALGIGERGVRQRIIRGTLPAQLVGGQWLIRPSDLPEGKAS